MTCGTPRPRGYALGTPSMRPGSGAGSLAALGQWSILGSAELVGTLELSFGGEPQRGPAAAERPQGGSWTVPQTGYCVGGRGPLQLAVITPAENGRPARFELRGPANRIQRPRLSFARLITLAVTIVILTSMLGTGIYRRHRWNNPQHGGDEGRKQYHWEHYPR